MKSILIKFLTVLCCLLCVNRAFAGDIKFVQITDSHYEVGNDYSKEVLEEAVKQVNKLKGVSFVVLQVTILIARAKKILWNSSELQISLTFLIIWLLATMMSIKTAECQKLTILKLLKTTIYFINPQALTML